MFDILVYLFENYFDSGSYPDSATLTRKLTMAGFADEDITETLDWLSELERHDIGNYSASLAENDSVAIPIMKWKKLIPKGEDLLASWNKPGSLIPYNGNY